MHWVEVRRWQDYKNPGSVNEVRWRSQLHWSGRAPQIHHTSHKIPPQCGSPVGRDVGTDATGIPSTPCVGLQARVGGCVTVAISCVVHAETVDVHVQDPIFKGYSVPNPEPGYPGGIFDPFGFSKVRSVLYLHAVLWMPQVHSCAKLHGE